MGVPHPHRAPAPGATQARRWRYNLIVIGMFAPALATLSVLYVGALAMALSQSLGHAPLYRVLEFPTLRFYGDVLGQQRFWITLAYTFYYALVPTVVGTVVSVYLALLLQSCGPSRRFFQVVYRLPLMIPYLVGAAVIIVIFSSGGILARLLYALNVIGSPADFPRILFSSGGWGIMLVYLWKQVPFTTLVVSAVLAGLGRDLEEAARCLGATRWQAFWHVILPRIMPGIVTATVLVFAFNFGSFEVPYLLGAHFPNTLPVEAWRAFDTADYTQRPLALAYVMVISLISGAILLLYLTAYRRFERSRGGV